MALPATDTFTTGSDQSLTAYSASWTINQGGWNVSASNDYALPTTTDDIAHWNADVFDADQYAQVTFPLIFAGYFLGVALRCHATNADAYCVLVTDDTTLVYRFIGGAGTELGTSADTWSQNDELRAEVETTDASTVQIRVYQNDTLVLTVNDTNASRILSGSAGIFGFGPNGGAVDNWEGGNLAVAANTRRYSLTMTGVG